MPQRITMREAVRRANKAADDAEERRHQVALTEAAGSAFELRIPTISHRDVSDAVMLECSCGGGAPDDKHTCPACRVYHRLVTKLPNAERSDGDVKGPK